MKALIYDNTKGGWAGTRGMWLSDIEKPTLSPGETESVIVKMKYAGFCGSDRGIWARQSFGELIESRLQKDNKSIRIMGHELLGEVVETGSEVKDKYNINIGDIVAAESHNTCGQCYQCLAGDKHVCSNDSIIGISEDGCFAEYVKVPAKILWPTDINKIDPRVAAIQEPFGNAVHSCTQTSLKDKTVAIFGCGAIGMMSIIVARGLGAKRIIGIEPNPDNAALAREVGADEVIVPGSSIASEPWQHDPAIAAEIMKLTDGVGADVSLEMSGFNSSVNNAIKSTRRGGHVVFFGLKAGNFVFEDFEHVIRNGLQMHCVIGRQIWRTWETTKSLLEDRQNGIQDKLLKYVLKGAKGSIVKFQTFDRDSFEKTLKEYPKVVFEF
jgi:threonine 3-dehydrogenase